MDYGKAKRQENLCRAGSQRPDYGKRGEGVKQTGSSALGVALTRSTDDLSMQGGEGILENS